MKIKFSASVHSSLPVVIILVGLSLPTHPFLDGVMVTLYFIPHESVLRSQPPDVPLQLCWCPTTSTAEIVCTTSGVLSFQEIDTTPVLQSMVEKKFFKGHGAT